MTRFFIKADGNPKELFKVKEIRNAIDHSLYDLNITLTGKHQAKMLKTGEYFEKLLQKDDYDDYTVNSGSPNSPTINDGYWRKASYFLDEKGNISLNKRGDHETLILDRVEYLGRIDVKHAELQKILREHELILGGDYKQYDYKVAWRYDSIDTK